MLEGQGLEVLHKTNRHFGPVRREKPEAKKRRLTYVGVIDLFGPFRNMFWMIP